MANTHLSIETTYIASPICYTMMLPNMPFRKADAHPLRLNTRCKDLTLVPSSDTCGNSGASDSSPPSLICSLASWRPKRPNKQAMSCVLKIWQASKKTSLMSLLPKMHQIYIYIHCIYIYLYIYIYIIYNIYIIDIYIYNVCLETQFSKEILRPRHASNCPLFRIASNWYGFFAPWKSWSPSTMWNSETSSPISYIRRSNSSTS